MSTASNDDGWPADAHRLYEAALDARHAGRLEEALSLGAEALRATTGVHRLPVTAIHGELAYVHMLREEHAAAEAHFRAASEASPRSELASLGLFHTLMELSEFEAALREAIRFVTLRRSSDYADMFHNGFRDDVDEGLRQLADEVRRLLAAHETASAE